MTLFLKMENTVGVRLFCGPLETDKASGAALGGIDTKAAFALVPTVHDPDMVLKMNDLADEVQDWVHHTAQALLCTNNQQAYDAVYAEMEKDMIKRQDAHLHKAATLAREKTLIHREALPETSETPATERTFARPDNTAGTWRTQSLEVGEFTAPTSGTVYRILRNNVTQQKKCGWKSMQACIGCQVDVLPAAASNAHCLVVATLDDQNRIQVCVYDTPTEHSFRTGKHSYGFSFALDNTQDLVLRVSVWENTHVAVCYGRGVVMHQRDTSTATLHTIDHPSFVRPDQHMIGACLVQSPERLVLGTCLGCVWVVEPYTDAIHQFIELPRIVAIRALRCHQDVIAAITVGQVIVIPPEEDFVRAIECVRAMDVALCKRALFALNKYGCVTVYDLEQRVEPSFIQPPAKQCNTPYVMPWYHALHLTPNERFLNVLYPDALACVYQLKQ